jgi:hypothetical protein
MSQKHVAARRLPRAPWRPSSAEGRQVCTQPGGDPGTHSAFQRRGTGAPGWQPWEVERPSSTVPRDPSGNRDEHPVPQGAVGRKEIACAKLRAKTAQYTQPRQGKLASSIRPPEASAQHRNLGPRRALAELSKQSVLQTDPAAVLPGERRGPASWREVGRPVSSDQTSGQASPSATSNPLASPGGDRISSTLQRKKLRLRQVEDHPKSRSPSMVDL